MCEQRSAWREANWIGENLVNEQQPVWAELESIQNKIVDNEVKIDYLMCITEMEQLFSKFTTITAANARELATKASAAEHSKHDLEHEVDLCWANIQLYAGLVNIHVRHAAEYHRFYHFVNQVNIKISQVSEQLNKMLHENDFKNCGGTPEEARQLANILKNTLHQYESIETQCERIDNRCQSIVPVNLRAQPLLHEVDGIMLCDYDANNFKFRAGDRIEVVRNWTPFKCDVNSHGMNGTSQSGLIQEQPNMISSETETSPNAQNTVIRFGAFPLGSNSLPEGSKNLVNNTTPYWCVRTVENAAIYAVPAVAVCLLPPASDAVTVAKNLKMKLLESWKHTIDLLFNSVIAFLRQFLRMIKDSETYMVADYDALQRLFTLIQESCSREKDEIFDTELAKLLEVAQATSFETYEQTPEKSDCFLRRSDIAQYMSVIATLSMLTHKSEIFELRCKSGVTFRKLGEQVDHEVKRMLLSVNTINEIARLDLFKVQKLLVELRRLQTMGSSQEQTNTKRGGFSRSISDDQDDLEVAHFSDPVFWSPDARPNASRGRTQSQPVTGQPAGAFRSNYLFIRRFMVRGPNYSLSRTSLPLDQNRWSSDCEWETPYVKSVYSRSTSITEAGRYGLSGSVCHTQSSWVSARLSPDRDLLQSPHRSVSFVSKVPNYHVEYSISIPPVSTCAQTQTDNQGIEEQFRYLDREQNSYPFRRIQLDDIKPPQEETQLTKDGKRQLEEPERACFSQRITSPIYKRRLNRNKRKQRTLGGKGENAEPTERRDEKEVDENMMNCTTEQGVKAKTVDERTISTTKVKQSKRRASIETKATISLSASQQRENHLCTNCTSQVSKCSTLAVENSTQYATNHREQNTQTDIMHSTTHSTKLTELVETDVVQTKSTTTNIIYAAINGTATTTGATDSTAEKPTTATENETPRSMKDIHTIKNQSTMCHTSTQYTTKHTPTTITAIECATVAMTTEPIRAEIQHREEQTNASVVEGITQMTKQIVSTKETQTQTQKTTHSFCYVNTSTAKVSELITINSAHTQPEHCEQGAQTDRMHVVIDDGHPNEYFGTTHSTSPLRISLSISPTNCIHCSSTPSRLPVASSFPVLCTVSSCYAKSSFVSSPCFPVSFLSNMHTFLPLLCPRELFYDSPNFPAFTSQISLYSLPSYLLQFSSRSLGLQRHFSAPHIRFSDSMFPQYFRIHRSVRDFWCQFSAFRHAMVDCFVAKYTLNIILEARPDQTNLINDPCTQRVPVSTPSFAIHSDDRTMSDRPLSPAQFTEIPVSRDVGISVCPDQVDLADFGVTADLLQGASEPVFSVHSRWDGLPISKAFVESTLFAWPKTACMGTQTLNKANRFYTPITKSNPSFLLVVDSSANYCRPITATHLIWGSQSLDLISETLDESENQSFDDEFSYPDQHR
ncbi:hypothetical protein FGIG_09175 [Fasciola gigantica]|uniref:Desmoplakin SH3 domain-containing protein n=1 Tax=Fasciola gigantica TaxID=46835 RepID=A0A504Y8D9_FASGI|nr:hypothetical protein FGIG_09175 [Fasciola gigantica]